MCSFWYIECLAQGGYLEAQLAFGKMLTYANHLGLYSEQIGASGELLGNLPQAFTHLAIETRAPPSARHRTRAARPYPAGCTAKQLLFHRSLRRVVRGS